MSTDSNELTLSDQDHVACPELILNYLSMVRILGTRLSGSPPFVIHVLLSWRCEDHLGCDPQFQSTFHLVSVRVFELETYLLFQTLIPEKEPLPFLLILKPQDLSGINFKRLKGNGQHGHVNLGENRGK